MKESLVRIGSEVSDPLPISTGVPQGAVLSPMLFNIMLQDLPHSPEVQAYCYADDLTFGLGTTDLSQGTRQVQQYMNQVVNWLEDWGMVVSREKSAMQIFSRKRKIASVIRIKNQVIPIKKEQRLLGLILDAPT